MSLIDLTALVTVHNVGPLTLERSAPPTLNTYGEAVQGATTLITLDPVCVHTVDGRDVLQVPEADRTKELTKFYTTMRLFVSDGFTDVINWRGRKWRVITVMDYEEQAGVYISIGVLQDVQS